MKDFIIVEVTTEWQIVKDERRKFEYNLPRETAIRKTEIKLVQDIGDGLSLLSTYRGDEYHIEESVGNIIYLTTQ